MKKKKLTSEQSIKKLRAIEVMIGQGKMAAEASKVESISDAELLPVEESIRKDE